MPDVVVKACFKCGVSQPLSEFYRHAMMADGHLNKCKACSKRDVLEHRRKNLDKVRAYDRERAKHPHRIALNTAGMAAYRKRFPERYKANSAVGNALRTGVLTKGPCEVCGISETESHHVDYSRPLSVVWLCPAHHHEIHLGYPDDHYQNVHEPKPIHLWQHNAKA